MTTKQRLSVTIDPDLLAAIQRRVHDGRAESLSAWVNDALRRQLGHADRLAAMAEFIDEYEAKHGVVTDEEAEKLIREARSRAIVVRGRTPE
jgi:Arc/MetJ-type ribon-helix-helix transcriptional regulator